jgi:hypothetical protein
MTYRCNLDQEREWEERRWRGGGLDGDLAWSRVELALLQLMQLLLVLCTRRVCVCDLDADMDEACCVVDGYTRDATREEFVKPE